MKFLIYCLLGLFLITTSPILGQESDTKTQSPYFLIKSGEDRPMEFILESTAIEATITGPIADVEVVQRYTNHSQVPIEAIYVFPASNRAAVYGVEMMIGDRVIKAQIKEKQEARQQYETAKQEGKRASLLEQQNPNVFQMNVANILPGDVVDIKMKYNEFLIPEGGEYTFVYPTVVGPRYTGESKAQNTFAANPYLKKGERTPYDFDMKVNLNSPIHIQKAGSISHKVDTKFSAKKNLVMTLDASERDGGNRDFIFQYTVADSKISAGTSFYDHGDEQFFLSIIEPPQKVDQQEIVPREYIFIVDVSGSMHGFPLEVSKELMRNLLGQLRPEDSFNVLLFESNSQMMFPSSEPVNAANIIQATSFVNQQRGGGGTNMLRAIKKAMSVPKGVNTSRSFVIVSDGYVSVEREAFSYIEDNLGNANFFAFGIGSGVNRYIIDGIAHVGRGEPFVITSPDYAKATADKFKKYIETPILTNIKVEIEGMEVYDVTPKHIPDLMAERPIYIFGKYRGEPKGNLTITGSQGNGEYEKTISLANQIPNERNAALRYLWAREKIRYLSDFQSVDNNEAEKKQIIKLGLKYNLLTSFTSFLAIEEVPVLANGNNTKKVRQALPMPQGVSNYAIGFEMGSANVVGAETELDEAFLFVRVVEPTEKVQSVEITKLIEEALKYTDEEARNLLHANRLSITLVRGRLIISDARSVLSKEMKIILSKNMKQLKNELQEGQTIKIELLWL